MTQYENLDKVKKMKLRIKRYYKVISSSLAFIVNTIGLVLSFFGAFGSPNESNEKQFTIIILICAEVFLVLSVIYSTITMVKSYYDKETVDAKEIELAVCRESNATIFENYKRNITDYKDFKNRLHNIVEKHCKVLEQHESLNKLTIGTDVEEEVLNHIAAVNKLDMTNLKDTLIEQYNRFMIKTLDSLRDNIEEYLITKGCRKTVSVAVKQLHEPVKYSKIDQYKSVNNIYTAFRDSRTYFSKTRNETWQKQFSISKNSDFMLSIEKDYYIFNFMNKTYMDNGLYLNENQNFYENYNSGVTCTIYSCIGEERILYGFLACDSLLTPKSRALSGKAVYDYNVANMLMTTAHIIGLYLQDFLDVWNNYYIAPQVEVLTSEKAKTTRKGELNLCAEMVDEINSTRYIS